MKACTHLTSPFLRSQKKFPPLEGQGEENIKQMEHIENPVQAGPNNNWHYNKKLQPFANELRKRMTKAEACLWKYALKSGKLSNWQFRRQRPILNYIADFMCKELLIVIETDGITHLWKETIVKDKKKDKDLELVGFKILRFPDSEVLNDISNVIRTIEYWTEVRRKDFKIPPPVPRQRGKLNSNEML